MLINSASRRPRLAIQRRNLEIRQGKSVDLPDTLINVEQESCLWKQYPQQQRGLLGHSVVADFMN